MPRSRNQFAARAQHALPPEPLAGDGDAPSYAAAYDEQPAQELERQLVELFESHAEEWHGLALNLLAERHDDAAEVVQEAFVRCWLRRETLHDVKNLRGYIATTIANLSRDVYRRRKSRPMVPLITDEGNHDGSHPATEAPAVSAALEHDETNERLRVAISELSVDERDVFLLRQNAEMSYGEIAEALGLPEGTVKTRMRRALSRLRQALT